MVQLSAIPDRSVNGKATPAEKKERQKAALQLAAQENEFTTSVYGSRFADEDLPRHDMPENEMPREIAYQLIKDDMSLDGNPKLK